MKCKLCPNTIGQKYVTLIGRTPKDIFQICWECWSGTKGMCDGTAYHPSIHDNGPPPEGTQQ